MFISGEVSFWAMVICVRVLLDSEQLGVFSCFCIEELLRSHRVKAESRVGGLRPLGQVPLPFLRNEA